MKKLSDVGQALRHFYWTLILQAVVYVVLGLLILFYPYFLVILAAIAFVAIGLLSLVFAWKVRALLTKLPDILK